MSCKDSLEVRVIGVTIKLEIIFAIDSAWACILTVSVCAYTWWVLTMQQSRWADTPAIDRSRSELRRRSTASGSRWLALPTSLPPLLSSPGQTADGHRPGNKDNNRCHCKLAAAVIQFMIEDVALWKSSFSASPPQFPPRNEESLEELSEFPSQRQKSK